MSRRTRVATCGPAEIRFKGFDLRSATTTVVSTGVADHPQAPRIFVDPITRGRTEQRATLRAVKPHRSLVCLALVAVSSVVLAVGCDRNTETFVEGEKPRAPDLARIFPESEGAGPGLAPPNAPGMPGAQRGNVPPARAEVPRQAPAQQGAPPVAAQSAPAGATISGTIVVDPSLAGAMPSGGMLFVIARPFGVNAGPPMAVLRMPSPRFPVAFEIGPDNVMIPSMRFEGDIGISARLDSDGNAMTKLPGDLSGATPQPLQPGAKDVKIVLDEKL